MSLVSADRLFQRDDSPLGWVPSPDAMPFGEALACALAGASPEERWLESLIGCNAGDALELFAAADKVREKHVGPGVYLRGLLEFSNICRRDCCYCGLRRSNRGLQRYRLTIDEMVAYAKRARELEYGTVVLQSGEDSWFTTERLSDVVRRIRKEVEVAITLSVGEREEQCYRELREAGADRVLLRIETTDPELFRRLHPDSDLGARKKCLQVLKSLGYQLGTGIMIGLPGQTPALVARDVVWMHELGAEMIGIGPFLAHPDTPLAKEPSGTLGQALRLIAVLRLVFPRSHIPATTAVGTVHSAGREKALRVGANVMMPNISPVDKRKLYQLYADRICVDETADDCKACLERRIASVGRTIAIGPGHVLRGS